MSKLTRTDVLLADGARNITNFDEFPNSEMYAEAGSLIIAKSRLVPGRRIELVSKTIYAPGMWAKVEGFYEEDVNA